MGQFVRGASPSGQPSLTDKKDVLLDHAEPPTIRTPGRLLVLSGPLIKEISNTHRPHCAHVEAAEGRTTFSEVFHLALPDQDAYTRQMKDGQSYQQKRNAHRELHEA
jgi:hypothetical protein